jgi:hypothetical protein
MKKWVIYSSLFGMASFGLLGCGGGGGGTPTEWTITFNFKSTPLFDASGKPLPRPTSPVIIQGYTAIFSYSSGCPPFLPTSDTKTVYYVVPAPSGGESTAQVSITYSTQPFATSVGISNYA